MNPTIDLKQHLAARHSRRAAIKTLGLGALGVGALGLIPNTALAAGSPSTDAAVLNFALNLEYLEAEYYVRAFTGKGIDDQGTASVGITGSGTLGAVTIKPNPKVTFATQAFADYAEEIASDELAHVKFLRGALQAAGVQPVARPAIDLLNSFNAAAQAATIGPAFDPFANEVNFLVGAFIFEDVGVTAYKGAAKLITNKTFLEAAAGILAVEAYHAGIIRTVLYQLGETTRGLAKKISDLRDGADGASDLDQGITLDGTTTGKANLVPTDANSLAFSRTTQQVLNIVYLNASGIPGGFFPSGLNGGIR